jgi:predicted aminopeptidase
MDVFEVSPVLRGAGVNTACLAIKSEGATLADHSEAVLTAVKELAERLKSLTEIRRKQGRAQDITHANKERTVEILKSLAEAKAELEALLASPAQPDKAEVERLFLAFAKLNIERN